MSNTVLITGGSGFIGAAAARELLRRDVAVVLLDQRPPSRMGDDDPIAAAKFVRGDVLDSFSLVRAVREHGPERVVHAAAIVGAGLSIDSPLATVTTNVLGMTNTLEAARSFGLGRFVFISSQSAYGPGRYQPVDEEHPTNPDSPYGATKLASEKLGNVYARCFGVDFVALRMSHIYGPGRPGGLRGNVIQDMLTAAQAGETYRMPHGGDQTKEPTYIDDIAVAVCAALEVPAARLDGRVYNVGTAEVVTWKQIGSRIREMYPSARMEIGGGPIEVRPGLPEQVLGPLDCRRAERVLGFRPRFDLERGLAQFAQWLEQRRAN